MLAIDSDSYRVECYFEETKMPVIKPGERVEIHLMSGEPALQGHLEGISYSITDLDNANGPDSDRRSGDQRRARRLDGKADAVIRPLERRLLHI